MWRELRWGLRGWVGWRQVRIYSPRYSKKPRRRGSDGASRGEPLAATKRGSLSGTR